MPRYKLTLEYDGTGLLGWQRQEDGPTMQQHLEDAVYALTGERVTSQVAGRTDAGVHAEGQVAHIDLSKPWEAHKLVNGLAHHLGEAPLALIAAEEVSDDFHARFSARARHYRYQLINRRGKLALMVNRAWQMPLKLEVEPMREAAQHLLGHHDFTSFRSSECQAKSPIKTLDRLEIEQRGEQVNFYVSSRSFLHNQVRILVGTLVQVGVGKWAPERVKAALEAKDRTAAGPTAPACGLFLTQVEY